MRRGLRPGGGGQEAGFVLESPGYKTPCWSVLGLSLTLGQMSVILMSLLGWPWAFRQVAPPLKMLRARGRFHLLILPTAWGRRRRRGQGTKRVGQGRGSAEGAGLGKTPPLCPTGPAPAASFQYLRPLCSSAPGAPRRASDCPQPQLSRVAPSARLGPQPRYLLSQARMVRPRLRRKTIICPWSGSSASGAGGNV